MRDHRTVPHHELDSHHLLAHHAVAQNVDTTGIGGDHPADRAALPRPEIDTEGQPGGRSVPMETGERHPGTHGDLRRYPIDGFHVIKTAEVHDHLTMQWHSAPDHAGVPTLRHQRRPGPGARGNDAGDVVCRGRAYDAGRSASKPSRPVDRKTGCEIVAEQNMVGSDDRDELVDQRLVQWSGLETVSRRHASASSRTDRLASWRRCRSGMSTTRPAAVQQAE